MFGLLNINKPPGPTSRDVVNRVQRLIRPVKVGHAGTLDPIASGVLVLCLGPATRLIEHVQRMEKRYVATFRLGCTSPSDDIEIEPTPLRDAAVPSLAEIEAALPSFIGDIQQVPPAYSAVKVQGAKAYERVRRGEAVELAPRPVSIYGIEIVRYEHPELELAIRCGSGTYVRSLGRDLAESLGTGAVMCGLRRTAIGPFSVSDALSGDHINAHSIQAHLLPAALAVADLPSVTITGDQAAELRRGRPIPVAGPPIEEVAVCYPERELLALGRHDPDGRLWPTRVFAH